MYSFMAFNVRLCSNIFPKILNHSHLRFQSYFCVIKEIVLIQLEQCYSGSNEDYVYLKMYLNMGMF